MSDATAVVLIDPYNDFLHPEGKANPLLADSLQKTDTIKNLHALIKASRSHKIPIFYCMHQQTNANSFKGWAMMNKSLTRIRDSKTFEQGTFGAQYFEGMEPNLDNGDVVVSKHWNSRYGSSSSL
jgi:nicotinamidase-related amidase